MSSFIHSGTCLNFTNLHQKKGFFVNSWWKKPKEYVYLILLTDLI